MTRGTGTRRSIDPVLSLKTEMLLRLVENNDVTVLFLSEYFLLYYSHKAALHSVQLPPTL